MVMDNPKKTSSPTKGRFDAASLLVVEEMLGHLYAKPPTAEFGLDSKVSGLNGSQVLSLTKTSSGNKNVNSTDFNIANSVFTSKSDKGPKENLKSEKTSSSFLSIHSHLSPSSSSSLKKNDVSITPSMTKPAITLSLGTLVKEKAALKTQKRKMLRKDHALKSKQGSSGKSCEAVLFPTPAHFTSGHSISVSKVTPTTPAKDSMPLPLDLCTKRSGTSFLPADITITPVNSSTKEKSSLHVNILETLPVSLVKVGSPKRRGRKPKNTLLNEQVTIGLANNQASLSKRILPAGQDLEMCGKAVHNKHEDELHSHHSVSSPADSTKMNRKRMYTDISIKEVLLKSQEDEDNKDTSGSGSDCSSDDESSAVSLSGTSDTEDTEKSATASTSSSIPTSTSGKVSKRHTDEPDCSPKRKRYFPDEREIRIPLEHGWRRQTKIRCFSRSGVRGEVTYFAPCGKKLKNYPEVIRYLQKNGINDIGRENFSFSSKINIGEFVEVVTGKNGPEECLLLNENEVAARLEEVRARKGSLGIRRGRPRKSPDRLISGQIDLVSRCRESQPAEEVVKQKDHDKPRKLKDKAEHVIHQRSEKEKRTQVLLEERKKRDELEKQRQEETLRKSQEKEVKRQQATLMREQERERRRQHMLLVRALENRKKIEEREKKREEVLNEKKFNKEKKLEQRRMDLQVLREMRKPVEDMLLKDASPLPILKRIPGLKVPGTAFANILMVFEFLHNFGEVLQFDLENLPTLSALQLGIINQNEKDESELLSLTQQLLMTAVHDPGVPYCREAITVLGQHLKETDVTNDSLTEALRLYFMALDKDCAMYLWVTEKPFLALNPTQKSEIIAFLCNELLCNRLVLKQIDNSIETVNSLRKDKWIAEGDLRKLRGIQQSRQRRAILKQDSGGENKSQTENSENEDTREDIDQADRELDIVQKSLKDEDDDEVGNDSGNESDDTQDMDRLSEEEDEESGLTNEELEKRIEKLTKQQMQYQSKLSKMCTTLRATMLGQDRYRRRYWVLPCVGGIFVEAMESGEQDGMGDFIASDYINEENYESSKELEQIRQMEGKEKFNFIEEPNKENTNTKNENIDDKEHSDENNGRTCDVKNICFNAYNAEKDKETILTRNVQEKQILATSKSIESATNLDNNWLMHSPFFASILAGSMLFNGPFSSGTHDVNGAFLNAQKTDMGSFLGFPPNYMSAEQVLKNLADKQPKPWFSILPRMPCDEASIIISALKLCEDGKREVFNGISVCSSEVSSQAKVLPGDALVRKVVINKLQKQHEKPQPVPQEYQRGWWRIIDGVQLREIMTCLHSNGIREKMLMKQLEKSFNYANSSCIPDSREDISLEVTAEDSDVLEKYEGAPPPDYEDQWCPDVALRVDITLLRQVEALEEKVANASMQVKGWRVPPKMSEDDTVIYQPSCLFVSRKDYQSCFVLQSKDTTQETGFVSETDADGDSIELKVKENSDKTKMEELKDGEHEVPSGGDDDEDDDESSVKVKENGVNPIEIAKSHLLDLEAVIERRYIRPPLGNSGSTLPVPPSSTSSSNGEEESSEDTEDTPQGLLKWRQAVKMCHSGAQLAMCIGLLERCIAWDRSIMKASCQFCHSGDNEEMLLLCDGCDKGYHTYCFKPKMESIPEGDWFCFECLNKTQEEQVCVVCGKKGKLLNCDNCPKVFHLNCLEPPLIKPPKGKWVCSGCSKAKKSRGRPIKEAKDQAKDQKDISKKTENTPPSKVKISVVDRREKNKSQLLKDLMLCKVILEELEKHDDAWPFLLPVNTKQFPSYKKFIKKPMDVSTIKSRLESNCYKTKEEFASDVRLIFDNCETFNEDESPVGQAGHSMRAYFESRWHQLFT